MSACWEIPGDVMQLYDRKGWQFILQVWNWESDVRELLRPSLLCTAYQGLSAFDWAWFHMFELVEFILSSFWCQVFEAPNQESMTESADPLSWWWDLWFFFTAKKSVNPSLLKMLLCRQPLTFATFWAYFSVNIICCMKAYEDLW